MTTRVSRPFVALIIELNSGNSIAPPLQRIPIPMLVPPGGVLAKSTRKVTCFVPDGNVRRSVLSRSPGWGASLTPDVERSSTTAIHSNSSPLGGAATFSTLGPFDPGSPCALHEDANTITSVACTAVRREPDDK